MHFYLVSHQNLFFTFYLEDLSWIWALILSWISNNIYFLHPLLIIWLKHKNWLYKKIKKFRPCVTFINIHHKNLKHYILKILEFFSSIKSPLKSICFKTKDDVINFDDKKITNIFKKFFCTIGDDLLTNLPPPSSRFGLNLVRQYYEKILKYPNSKFKFNFVSEETV